MTIKQAIKIIIEQKNLCQEDAYQICSLIMSGNATPAQISALLIGLALKGETIPEITGFVQAMREKAARVKCQDENVIDTCGTGGDGTRTFNISTVAALVAAGAGCAVAKHGNRSVSSNCGSADLLTHLGVNIDIEPERMAQCIDMINMGFLFAPILHGAMKYAIKPRQEIGIRTIFNILLLWFMVRMVLMKLLLQARL
jgi:anthranilate phosphoribosyltransferase